MREFAGRSPYDVARTPNIGSRSALLRLEGGETRDVLMPVVDHLCRYYGADRDLRHELNRMAIACSDSGTDAWWEPVGTPTWAGLLFELEPKATTISTYETESVAGLLQTERTIRALLVANPRLTAQDVDDLTRKRLARQSRVLSDAAAHSPMCHFVLSEAALRRRVGGTDVHAEQMKHLKELDRCPTVSVSIVRFDVGATPGTAHPFVLLDFPKDYARTVVYSESALGATYSDALDEVTTRKGMFKSIRAVSVPIGDFVLWR
ncbi:helix-turn-helix transcriptional regulator [Stackebrandtia albiflava]